MKHLLIIIYYFVINLQLSAQNADSLISELQTINKNITKQTGALLSNRAMNMFLADKTGYVSENGDLSYFTNYVTFNSTSGLLTINHNFQNSAGTDEPINQLFSVGVKANIINGLNSTFTNKRFENELGITINKTWLSKVKTITGNQIGATTNHKNTMDVIRAGLVYSITAEVNSKVHAFEKSLDTIQINNLLPSIDQPTALNILRKQFYHDLQEEYQEKFARLQAEKLTQTNNFKTIKAHWTSLIAYIPLAFPKYNVAPNFNALFNLKNPYPFELLLNHTLFWENSRLGKLFVTLSGKLAFSHSINSFDLFKTNLVDYKKSGGTDTLSLASIKSDHAYIGHYKNFLTPSLLARVVYFSHESHVGISLLAQQHLGTNNLLNARLGIPVVLINSKRTPALNIEFQVSFFDLTNKINTERKLGNKTSIGVGIGFPMSRLMY